VNFAIVAKINAKENGKIVVLLFLFFSIQKHCKAWSIIFQQFSASLPGWMKEILRFSACYRIQIISGGKSGYTNGLV
jgi:hypothetical protein